MNFKHNHKGFTLVELVVSMAVFAIATVAISSILVCAIRYSGLSFREEANLREVMTVERVLEAALKDATKIEALIPQEEDGNKQWVNLGDEKDLKLTNGIVLLRFSQKSNTKVYEILYKKETDGSPIKLWYRIGDTPLTEVPYNEEGIETFGMTLLSEKIKDLEIIYTNKTLDYKMTVKNQATEHNLHRYWDVGVGKTSIDDI